MLWWREDTGDLQWTRPTNIYTHKTQTQYITAATSGKVETEQQLLIKSIDRGVEEKKNIS